MLRKVAHGPNREWAELSPHGEIGARDVFDYQSDQYNMEEDYNKTQKLLGQVAQMAELRFLRGPISTSLLLCLGNGLAGLAQRDDRYYAVSEGRSC